MPVKHSFLLHKQLEIERRVHFLEISRRKLVVVWVGFHADIHLRAIGRATFEVNPSDSNCKGSSHYDRDDREIGEMPEEILDRRDFTNRQVLDDNQGVRDS